MSIFPSGQDHNFTGQPSHQAINRIMQDFIEHSKENNPLIHIYMHDEDITMCDVLIIGPSGTPYENGFFHFQAQYPDNYPWSPPRVKIVNTYHGSVRFNPNLYSNGKVCLSILGTWNGPSWSAVQTMSSTFISIQSLLNECPYHNEPGYEFNPPESQEPTEYGKCIAFETFKTAICYTLESPSWSEETGFSEIAEMYFLDNYDYYINTARQRSQELDGSLMLDMLFYNYQSQAYDYASIINRLEQLKANLLLKYSEYKSTEDVETPEENLQASSSESELPTQPDENDEETASCVSTKTEEFSVDIMSTGESSLITSEETEYISETILENLGSGLGEIVRSSSSVEATSSISESSIEGNVLLVPIQNISEGPLSSSSTDSEEIIREEAQIENSVQMLEESYSPTTDSEDIITDDSTQIPPSAFPIPDTTYSSYSSSEEVINQPDEEMIIDRTDIRIAKPDIAEFMNDSEFKCSTCRTVLDDLVDIKSCERCDSPFCGECLDHLMAGGDVLVCPVCNYSKSPVS
eukprot:TRINITY_DN2766_c0_g1_i1.p1 TRINITY_DN2766_c0_g1~~TRINITY_DN2766_c0_g1_i1.p1  ORF type:complete len:522 (-),score=97.01 TRINITY_DN2766_c0_g1_i1:203-1768(-)